MLMFEKSNFVKSVHDLFVVPVTMSVVICPQTHTPWCVFGFLRVRKVTGDSIYRLFLPVSSTRNVIGVTINTSFFFKLSNDTWRLSQNVKHKASKSWKSGSERGRCLLSSWRPNIGKCAVFFPPWFQLLLDKVVDWNAPKNKVETELKFYQRADAKIKGEVE